MCPLAVRKFLESTEESFDDRGARGVGFLGLVGPEVDREACLRKLMGSLLTTKNTGIVLWYMG
jgi:hypothetical protein